MNEYQFLLNKDDDLNCDNIPVENEGIIEYGNDFINCKIILDRDSTQKYQWFFPLGIFNSFQ